jgi:hypothetical protein
MKLLGHYSQNHYHWLQVENSKVRTGNGLLSTSVSFHVRIECGTITDSALCGLTDIAGDGEGKGQNFRVLPSTSLPIALVPAQAEWCKDEECWNSRGIMSFNGQVRSFWVRSGCFAATQQSDAVSLHLLD